jgi:hypothetical protein
MTSVSAPRYPGPPGRRPRQPALRWNAWNVLLLVPLLALLTPLYNRIDPRLFGVPFFYWVQLVGLLLGMVCTLIVFQMTRRADYVVTDRPDLLDVDHLDEGAWR